MSAIPYSCPGSDSSDLETSLKLVTQFTIRACYRAVGVLPPLRSVALVISISSVKMKVATRLFHAFGVDIYGIKPRDALKGADSVAQKLDAAGLAMFCVVPMVDNAVCVSNILQMRLGKPSNDQTKAVSWRDKFQQQEVLRVAGLVAPEQCVASDVGTALNFAAAHGGHVVVKPLDASGNDGVWLCHDEADVRIAFSEELGKMNSEFSVNHSLIVVETLIGVEWVVNTVSLNGLHKVTDVWQGPSKSQLKENGRPGQFVYDVQFLAPDSDQRRAIIAFTLAALDALGIRNGAAHTELVWMDRPFLFEVNVRPAGGIPRTPHHPDQLEALVVSLCNPNAFHELPDVPNWTADAAVVFLKAPRDCCLSAAALHQFSKLKAFAFFERGLYNERKPFSSVYVRKTIGLSSSPGCVVLHGNAEAVQADWKEIRRLEETSAYIDILF